MKTNLADIGAIASKALPLCEPTPSEHKKVSMAAEKCRELVRRQVEGNDAIVEVLFGGSYAISLCNFAINVLAETSTAINARNDQNFAWAFIFTCRENQ